MKKDIEDKILKELPANFDPIDTYAAIERFKIPKGLDPKKNVPLSIFLKQEISQLQKILDIVRTMLQEMVKAIDGEVVMTPELVIAIDSMFTQRVPGSWMYDATGVEISWISPTLGSWLEGMRYRYRQLKTWVEKDRPQSFWLTGFMRPQGFLTAVKQEVTRQKSAEKWALDEVDYYTTVLQTEIKTSDGSIGEKALKSVPDGVLIHGLYMEGAQWNTKLGCLEESEGKDLKTLYKDFPVLHVTAETTKEKEDNRQQKGGKETREQLMKTCYLAPVYKYKARTDKYLIFRIFLKADSG